MKNLFLSILALTIGMVSSLGAVQSHCYGLCDVADVKLSTKNSALTNCDSKTEVIIYNSKSCVSIFENISLSDSANFTLDVNYGSVPCGDTSFNTQGYEFCTVGVEFLPTTDSGTFETTLQLAEGISTTITGGIDSSCKTECTGSPCDGKVTNLTFAFYGEDASTVEVFQGKYKDYLKTIEEVEDENGKTHHVDKKGKKYHEDKKFKKIGHITKEAINVYSGTLNYGEEFSVVGVDKHGTLGTTIFILVNGELHAELHTSCSVPIGPDLIVGDFTVVSGNSLNGGELASVTCTPEDFPEPTVCTTGNCEGKVTQLTLLNNGLDATITVTEKRTGAVIVDSAFVTTGEAFEFYGSEDDLSMGTEIYVTAVTADGVSTTTPIHTSCSVPIGPGAEFGVFEVVDGASLIGGELEAIVCPSDDTATVVDDTTPDTTVNSTNYLATLNLTNPSEQAYLQDKTLVFNAYNDYVQAAPILKLAATVNTTTMMIFDAEVIEGMLLTLPRSVNQQLATRDIIASKRYGFIFPNIALAELLYLSWGTEFTGTISNMSLVEYVNPDLLP